MSPLKPSLLPFKFENFANLPSEPNKQVFSEKTNDCNGDSWQLCIKPGGESASDDPSVSVYLYHLGKRSIVVSYSFILRDINSKVFHEHVITEHRFEGKSNWGTKSNFLKRSTILNETNKILDDGALLIDVHIQFMPKLVSPHTPSSLSKKMLKLLDKGEGDVSFKVGDVVMTAHRVILQNNASVLFNFCEQHNDGSPIFINDTTPDIFQIVLRYVYGEEVPDKTTIKAKGKMIIDAADKFCVAELKVAVETALAKALILKQDNVADWLVFADAKTCPLLKEQAIAYFVSRSVDVLNSDASNRLKESPRLLTELILEGVTSSNSGNRFGDKQHVSVGELRKRLHEKGLDLDGSKEMLMSRLQDSNKRQRVE